MEMRNAFQRSPSPHPLDEQELITKMRKQCIQKSKENWTPLLWKKYTSLRNEVVTILRKPRREHLRKVSKQGCKQFWKTEEPLAKSLH